MTPELLRRHEAVVKTIDKYKGKSFDWASRDCIRMGRSHLVRFGHRPPALPRYRSAIGARRALVSTGHDTITSLLDSLLPRIAPASMWPGDIMTVDGMDNLEALWIWEGQVAFGWSAWAEGATFITPAKINAAWRV